MAEIAEQIQPKSHSSEVYVRGKWIKVPAVDIGRKTIVVSGTYLKTAAVRSEEWLETEVEDPEYCIGELTAKKSNVGRVDLFTFTQKIPATVPKYQYFLEWDSVATVRLINFQDWWEKLPQSTRKNVRRAEKRGVRISLRQFDDELIRELAELNNDSPVRQGERNMQFGKSLDQLRKDYSSFLDRSDLICAYHGKELIGFLKIVYRGQVASILNLIPKASHDDKRPANALIAKAMERCAEKGISHVTYGLFNYGNKQDSPLREFKIRNGFGEVLVPRYYVALSAWGALCLKMNLHRGLLGILPHRVITMGVNARSRWYKLRVADKPV